MSGLLIWSLPRSLNDCCITVIHPHPKRVLEIMRTPTLFGVEVWGWEIYPERGELLLALRRRRGRWTLRRGKVWLQVLGHSSRISFSDWIHIPNTHISANTRVRCLVGSQVMSMLEGRAESQKMQLNVGEEGIRV